MSHQCQAGFAREFTRLNGTFRFGQTRGAFVRDRLRAGLPTRTFQTQRSCKHKRSFGAIGEFHGIVAGIIMKPKPKYEFVAEEIAARFIGNPGDIFGGETGHERGGGRIVYTARVLMEFRQLKRAAAGSNRIETIAEGLTKERNEAFDLREGCRSKENFIRFRIPKNGSAFPFCVPAIFRFLLESFSCDLARFTLLLRRG